MQPLLEVKGTNGVLLVYENKITIVRKGFLAFASVGIGEKDIWMKSITGVNLKKNTLLTKGYFQVLLQGSNEMRGRTLDLTKDENTIIFPKKTEEASLKAKELLEQFAN